MDRRYLSAIVLGAFIFILVLLIIVFAMYFLVTGRV